LSAIHPGDADQYRAELYRQGLARNSVHKLIRYARHCFTVAVRREHVRDNPFAHLPATVGGNPCRRVFVPAADVLKVIDTAPDPEWKLLIAFARFQGLRIPSEALALTWFDVDFEHKRLVIRASKTEHHEGGGVRVQPIFPETAPLLQAVFDAAPEGVAHVITRYRDPTQNLRTQFERYITKAGLRPWVKLWQNLRASRATELADRFPSHVCAAWLGHTEQVADQHYRIVTDEHFARAVGDLVAQIPAHFSLERECPERNGEHAACERTLETKAVPFGALECPSEPYRGLGVTGLEPVTSSV